MIRLAPRMAWIFLTLCFGLFFLFHHLLPYFGIRYEGCQTMYSSLKIDYQKKINNHFFMPQWAWTDWGFYFDIESVELQENELKDEKAKFFVQFLKKTNSINLETLRLILDYLCPQFREIKITLDDGDHKKMDYANICEQQQFRNNHTLIPIQLFPANERVELKRPSK